MYSTKNAKPKRARKTPSRRLKADPSLTRVRSAITNGSQLLLDVDHRSAWMRRLRDLISGHVSDAGGLDHLSTSESSIIRRASMLELQLEMLEVKFAVNDGVASSDQLLLYQRTANSTRRLLEALGLQRRSRDITPSPLAYAKQVDAEAEEGLG